MTPQAVTAADWLLGLGNTVGDIIVAETPNSISVWDPLEVETAEDFFLEIGATRGSKIRAAIVVTRQDYGATTTMYHTANTSYDIEYAISTHDKDLFAKAVARSETYFPPAQPLDRGATTWSDFEPQRPFKVRGSRKTPYELGVYLPYSPRLDRPPDKALVHDIALFFLVGFGQETAAKKVLKRYRRINDPRILQAPSQASAWSKVSCPVCHADITPYGIHCGACGWGVGLTRRTDEDSPFAFEPCDT